MLVPTKHLTRANGMVQTGASLEGLLSPLLAGLLVSVIGVSGMILIDFVTYFVAVGTLLMVSIRQPEITAEQKAQKILKDIQRGWQFLSVRRGLIALAAYIALIN
jgi:hypothetical protein